MIAKEPLNIVVVGVGLIGPRHAQHVAENPETILMAIIDPSPKGQTVADELCTTWFPSIAEMFQYLDLENLPYPDGAIVCTPNHLHACVLAELAVKGVHLLVEKPVSTSLGEAKALKELAQEHDVKVLVGHHRRFNPFIVASKELLARVGEPIAIQGTWALHKDEEYFKMSPWRTNTRLGGGPLLINLVHDLDLLQYLLGPIERIYAEVMKKQRKEYPDVDEGACLTLRFKNGVTGTFLCSDKVVSPFNFESGTGENPTVPSDDQLLGFYRIFGSHGTLSVPDMTLYHQDELLGKSWLLPVSKSSLVGERSELRQLKPFTAQLQHFVEVIRGRAEPACQIDDGISALLCIEAVIRSIDTGLPASVGCPSEVECDYTTLRYKKK